MAAPSNLSLFGLPFTTGLNEADFNSPASSNSLSQLFGINAPTGPFLPQGTVSPLSDLFSQIPTGLANNQVTYTANNVTSDPGSMFLPTGSQWTPKPGYDIVYGVRQGTYGHFQIPSADVANAAQKYGIQVFGTPLTQQDINYHNNPSGGANQPGVVTGGTNNSTTSGGTNNNTVTTGGTNTNTNTNSNTTTNTNTTPQLPALDQTRQNYLNAIDAYIKSLPEYQYQSTITDDMRRALNLPGMAELQMNQQANPAFNAANFVSGTNRSGLPFIPGSAPPEGFQWKWFDPDGASGLQPANYALAPMADFFNRLPGSDLEDLQTLVNTFNDPKYANKYISGDNLGALGNLLMKGQNGQRAQLAPQESLAQLYPLLQRSDVTSYANALMNSVAGQLGSSYSPNYNVYNDIGDPTKVSNYFNAVNNALSLNKLPTISDLLASGTRKLDSSNFYQGQALDFYSPQDAPPAFFQYMLRDPDGTGGLPSMYNLRMKGAPNTQYDANQILNVLNDPRYSGMLGSFSNIPQNIFGTVLNTNGDQMFRILDSYKFPGGAGGPIGTGTQNTNTQSTGSGAAGGPALESTRWQPTAQDTINANQQQADMANTTQTQATALNGLYGSGGGGTTGLPNTPTPSTPNTTTTPDPNKPDPFSGLPTPTTGYQRPPKFWSPWAGF